MLWCAGESSQAGQADTAALPFVLERGAVRVTEFVLAALVSLVYWVPALLYQFQGFRSRLTIQEFTVCMILNLTWTYSYELSILSSACHPHGAWNDNCILGRCKSPWESLDLKSQSSSDVRTLNPLGSTSSTHLGTQSRSNLLPFTSYWNLWPTEAGSVSGIASFVFDRYPVQRCSMSTGKTRHDMFLFSVIYMHIEIARLGNVGYAVMRCTF